MNSILITGCNRGLGLGLVKALVNSAKPPNHIFATCRNLEAAGELQDLASKHSSIRILEIDLRNYNEFDRIAVEIEKVTEEQGLNVLFNNAGIAPKQRRLGVIKEQELIDALHTNTIAPILLTKTCLPLLVKASKCNSDEEMSVRRAAVINMSSILGSIERNTDGGIYAYRTSKAALNAATKSMSIDLKNYNILCVTMHPGWVRTDMGGEKAPLDVATSTQTLIETLFTFNSSHNGGFYQYDGECLPW